MEHIVIFCGTFALSSIAYIIWYLLNASDIIDRDTAANDLRCSVTGPPCDNCNCEGEEE